MVAGVVMVVAVAEPVGQGETYGRGLDFSEG